MGEVDIRDRKMGSLLGHRGIEKEGEIVSNQKTG
jgi:hypothetical protein